MAIDIGSYYDGSRSLTWLSDIVGLPIDLVNFLSSQFMGLILASLFRTSLHPTKASAAIRHAFGLSLGLFFGYFCFGSHAFHIAGLPALTYIIIRTQDPHIVQRVVLAVALIYLSFVHMHRQYYDYGSYTLDITGPLMVITQKVTSLAFSIHDGLARDDKELTKDQKYHAVYRIPTALEFFSYTFHFQGLMAGPVVFYRDYMDFIDGSHILKYTPKAMTSLDDNSNSKKVVLEPSPIIIVFKKVIISTLCALIFIKFIPYFSIKALKEDEFIVEKNIPQKFFYLLVATTLVRFKYYHAWILADAICNNSGLGFNGYDENDYPKWDGISNINILKFEFGLSFRDSIANWNMGTNRWLRMIVYDRVTSHGTALTYSLSALWHGFYPGYYLTFATGALFTLAARNMRRAFRPLFINDKRTIMFYDIFTCITTRIFMAYATFTFVLLEFWAGIRIYLHLYLSLHILAILALTVVPMVQPIIHRYFGIISASKVENKKIDETKIKTSTSEKHITNNELYKELSNGISANSVYCKNTMNSPIMAK